LHLLERWKTQANARRSALAEKLLSMPLSPERVEELELWSRNLATRKAWQEARLENMTGIESILRAAIERNTSAPARRGGSDAVFGFREELDGQAVARKARAKKVSLRQEP
jgi:hypothetical protein